ncbi:hypothetical protein FRC18_002735 [Serendipita sp. 400]|nr:hypothetical protein FRC18_002735 [Serendipita sp. 400]
MHRAPSSSIFRSLPLDSRFLLFLQLAQSVVTTARPVAATSLLHYTRQLDSTTLNNGLPTGSVPLSDPQAAFSDGGGSGHNVPALLWIVFVAVVGLPLAAAGVRGWRITSGIGLGLAFSLLLWCAFVNTTTGGSLAANPTTSDLFLSVFIWGAFFLGVLLGSLRVGIFAGVTMLGASAGAALGTLIVLLRPGLLFPIYALNILPLGLFAALGAAWPLWHQRLAVIVSSSTCGSFLIGLAVDLTLNKQSGMSLGLRFLLDRNQIHARETSRAGYKPPVSTLIILGVAIGLIPLLSFIQHRLFKQPFNRFPESLEEYNRSLKGAPVLSPGDAGYVDEKEAFATTTPQHIQMHFPSIVPSLPGAVDPQYSAQQQALRAQHEQANIPSRAAPGPGIGRLPFIPYIGAAVNAAKRLSVFATRRFSNTARRMSMLGVFGNSGAERRISTFSTPSIYSVNPMDRSGVANPGQPRPAGNGFGYGQQQQRPQPRLQQQLQQQSYEIARDSDAYSGIQVPATRPLNLPARQAPSANRGAARGAPPSSYTPSVRSARTQRIVPPPAAAAAAPSLRTNRMQGRSPGQQQFNATNYGSSNNNLDSSRSRGAPQSNSNRLRSAQRYNNLL